MKQISMLFFVFFLMQISAFGQSKYEYYLNVDVGVGNMNGEMNNQWSVRQDQSSTYGGYSSVSSSIFSDAYQQYISIKPEIVFSKRISLLSGVRLTQIRSEIIPYDRGSYFFLRSKETNPLSIDYFRVTSISEKSNYLSIPIELKINIFQPDFWGGLAFYGRLGGSVGFLLHSSNKIDFLNLPMEKYEREIIDAMNVKPNSALSMIYGGFGISYQVKNRPTFSLDLPLFAVLFSENNSTLTSNASSSIIQFTVGIPINKPKLNQEEQ